MASIPIQLLQDLTQALTRLPANPGDLAIAAAQLAAQLDGLAGLDALDLLAVEPATVLVSPPEAPEGPHAA